MNIKVEGIGVDAGMIMVADHDYFIERNPDYESQRSDLWEVLELPIGKYKVHWSIPETWNDAIEGIEILNVTSGKIIVTDPCYILGHVNDDEDYWGKWLDETNFGENTPDGTFIIDEMGGDGTYDIYLELEKI